MRFKRQLIISAALLLAGCAASYTYDGKRYASKEEFVAGVDSALVEATNSVQPLPKPVSTKTLVFAIPSEQVIHRQSVSNFQRLNARPIGMGEEIMLANITNSNYKNIKALHDAIKRRNIYANIRYLELDTFTGDLQASQTEDAFFYTEAQPGAGQWYYTNARSGKQAFAFDRGGVSMIARTKAFLESIQVFAIRD